MLRAAFLLAALVLPIPVHAFTPYAPERRVNVGPTLIEWVEAPGPFNCPAAVWRAGSPVLAVLGSGILFFYLECAIYQPGRCTIVSSGMTDFELGHEFRHCNDGDYHAPGLPFLDLP